MVADSRPNREPAEASPGDGSAREEVTRLLADWQAGDSSALDRLLPLVDAQLRRLAHAALHRQGGGHTLQTTALINEAFLRLVGRERSWEDSRHFLNAAAKAMRWVLVDYARKRTSVKRGGDRVVVGLDTLEPLIPSTDRDSDQRAEDLLELHEALEGLFALHERPARAIELHYFGGLTYAEVADVLAVSQATVDRDLRFARAWLFKELRSRGGSDER